MLSFSRILSRSQPIKNQLLKASVANFGHSAPHDLAHQNGHPGVNVVIDSKDIRMQPLELNVQELEAKANKTNYERFVLKQVKKDPSLLNLPKGPFMIKMRHIAQHNSQMALGLRWLAGLIVFTAIVLHFSPKPLVGNAEEHHLARIDAAPSTLFDFIILKKAYEYAAQADATEEGWLDILAAEPRVSDDVRAIAGAGNWVSIIKAASMKPSDFPYVEYSPAVSAEKIETLLAGHAAKVAEEAAKAAAKEAAKVVNATVVAQDQQ